MKKLLLIIVGLSGLLVVSTSHALSGNYWLKARHSGKAVVVQGASTSDGANVIQWTYGGSSTNDEWTLYDLGGGYHRVVNRHSGKDMVVQGASTSNGGDVIQWTYGGSSTNDEWLITNLNNGYYRFTNRHSGLVLDVNGNSTADGAEITQWAWSGGNNQQFELVAVGGGGGGSGFTALFTESMFNQMFPNRNSFYTYQGLVDAQKLYTAFGGSGDDAMKRREIAAAMANFHHETGGLVHVVEQNTANYCHYCDPGRSYGCPAGQCAYYGRGPIQLSWNFNYKAAGDAVGINLLNDPYQVQNVAATAWKTALWYWMSQNGPNVRTAHNCITGNYGFGCTIRSINGSLECDGKNPATVDNRVYQFGRAKSIIGATSVGADRC